MKKFYYVLLFLLFSFLSHQAISADPANILRSALAGKDYKKAGDAIKELKKTDQGKEKAKIIMKQRLGKSLAKYNTALKKTESPFKNLKKEKAVNGYFEMVGKWDIKRKEALEFIFDKSKYPLPPMPFSPGKDIQLNQAIVEGMVEQVIALWNIQEIQFCKLIGIKPKAARAPGGGGFAKKLIKGKISDPDKQVLGTVYYKFTDPTNALKKSIPKWRAIYKKYMKARDGFISDAKLAKKAGVKIGNPPRINPLISAVHTLFYGDVKLAVEKSMALKKEQKKLFAVIGHRYLLYRSMTPDGKWSKREKKSLVINNLYRLSLGLVPMLGNKKLYKAAAKHAVYQIKNGMGHGEKDSTRNEPQKRVKLEQYTAGGVTENVFSGADAIAGFWMWRMDSGHHKNLIRTYSRAAGIAAPGPATHNTGKSTEDKWLDQL